MQQNAAEVILALGRTMPDAQALHAADDAGVVQIWSYGELDRLVLQTQGALQRSGVQRGDRILIGLKDSAHFCAAVLGAMRAGAVAIPVNSRLRTEDYAFMIGDARPRLVLVDPELTALLEAAQLASDLRIATTSAWVAAVADAPMAADAAQTSADDSACWLYSSGTTGPPKGIVHTHHNVAYSAKLHREVLGSGVGTRVFSTSKLFFAFPFENAFLGPIAIGATTLINASWPEPERIIAQAASFRPEVFFTVPTLLRRLTTLDREALAGFAGVRHCYTGGERLPEAIRGRWRELTGLEARECYGTSETFCNVFAERPDRPGRGACGAPLPGVQTKLLDASGAPTLAGEPGILWVKMPTLAAHYTDPIATSQAFRDGWFCTNDVFIVDTHGDWFHQGRADELLRIAGQWVKPLEVERAVLDQGAIREAACVVVPDQDGFSRLALFVVPSTQGNDVQAIAARELEAKLPRHSQPKWIRVIGELPRTATGKIQRFRLRESLSKEIGEAQR